MFHAIALVTRLQLSFVDVDQSSRCPFGRVLPSIAKSPKNADFETASNSYAIDRTVLANERTFAALIRTGLAALAAGLAMEKFMIGVIPDWSHQVITVMLLVFSLAAFLVAAWRYTHIHLLMAHLDIETIPRSMVILISLGLAECSLIALSVILLAI